MKKAEVSKPAESARTRTQTAGQSSPICQPDLMTRLQQGLGNRMLGRLLDAPVQRQSVQRQEDWEEDYPGGGESAGYSQQESSGAVGSSAGDGGASVGAASDAEWAGEDATLEAERLRDMREGQGGYAAEEGAVGSSAGDGGASVGVTNDAEWAGEDATLEAERLRDMREGQGGYAAEEGAVGSSAGDGGASVGAANDAEWAGEDATHEEERLRDMREGQGGYAAEEGAVGYSAGDGGADWGEVGNGVEQATTGQAVGGLGGGISAEASGGPPLGDVLDPLLDVGDPLGVRKSVKGAKEGWGGDEGSSDDWRYKGGYNMGKSAGEWWDIASDPETSAEEKVRRGGDKAVDNVARKVGKVAGGMESAWDTAEGVAGDAWDKAQEWGSTAGEAAGKTWDMAKESGMVGGPADKALEGAGQLWDQQSQRVGKSAKEWWDIAIDPETSAEEKVRRGGDKAVGNVARKVGKVAGGAEKAWDTGKEVASGVGDVASDVWETVKNANPEEWQMKAEEGESMAPSGGVAEAIDAHKGGGQPLPDDLRRPAEEALGLSLKGVRLHTDSEADTLAASLQARAFTTGQDIFFRAKDFDPSSSAGRELLGHELTHVRQQHQGLSEPYGRVGDRYEQEADHTGAAMFGGGAAHAEAAGGGGGEAAGPQRQAAPEEEEPLQGKSDGLQRQAAPEEEEPLQGKSDGLQRQAAEDVAPWEQLPQSAAPELAPWEALPRSMSPAPEASKAPPKGDSRQAVKGAPKSQGAVYTAVKAGLAPTAMADAPRRVSNALTQGRGILKGNPLGDKLATRTARLYEKATGLLERSRPGGYLLKAGQALDPANWGKFGKATSPLGLVDAAANLVGAPKGVTDVTGVASGVTPIGAAHAGVGTAAQTAWNMAKGGVTSLVRGRVGKGSWEGLEKQNESMLASKSPIAGYNMMGRLIADPKETADKLVSKEAASGGLGPLAKWGNWLGDEAFKATSPILKWLERRKLNKK